MLFELIPSHIFSADTTNWWMKASCQRVIGDQPIHSLLDTARRFVLRFIVVFTLIPVSHFTPIHSWAHTNCIATELQETSSQVLSSPCSPHYPILRVIRAHPILLGADREEIEEAGQKILDRNPASF